MNLVLILLLAGLNDGARVGHAGSEAHEHWNAVLLAVVEGATHHVVGLLLWRRLEARHHSKVGIEARVLFILWRVHRWVVAGNNHKTAIGSCHCTIDKCVGTHVHAHMLHAHHGTLARVAHTQSFLHGCLLVGTPLAVNTTCASNLTLLNKLGNLGRWGTRISPHTAQSGMQCTKCQGLIAK